MFTMDELRKLHVRSGHPHWQKISSFLRRVLPDDCKPEFLQQLKELVN
jgi:hypothetical protein